MSLVLKFNGVLIVVFLVAVTVSHWIADRALLLVSLFVAVLVAVNILLVALVVRPLRKLTTIAGSVSLRNLDAQPEFTHKGHDVIADLAEAFNRLRRSVNNAEGSIMELEYDLVTLEGKLSRATADIPQWTLPHALLGAIQIPGSDGIARIELYRGDLTATTPEDAVDVLVVSAFPNSYEPTAWSLIGALHTKGISLHALAQRKYLDLRQAFSCWLSAEIPTGVAGINFKRILCYEPRSKTAAESIGDIFRALAPFIGADPHIRSVAMPLLATGSQMYTVSEMLPALLKSATEWLRVGLPLRTVKIYATERHADAAQQIFANLAGELQGAPEPKPVPPYYDAFISYSHCDSEAALAIADHLQSAGLRVFVDQLHLDKGAAWQQEIFGVMDQARAIIALYSPDYVKSKVCQEEFNIAWARKRKDEDMFVYPIYWRSSKLPTYMELLNFTDCREGQVAKLEGACATLTGKLRGDQ